MENKEDLRKNKKKVPPIIIITPSREIPWIHLVRLGKVIYNISEETNKKIVYIASSDHGRAHKEDGPYGYDKNSKKYDDCVFDLIKSNKLSKIQEFSEEFLDKAKPDSFWQMLILIGIIEEANLKNSFCVYECPDYYGMMVAAFQTGDKS